MIKECSMEVPLNMKLNKILLGMMTALVMLTCVACGDTETGKNDTEGVVSEVTEETEELVRSLLSETEEAAYTVTFRYNGNVFATQKVTAGEFAVAPLLLPSMTGSWDYDFTKPVEQDTIIDWKE
jgi:hypothetical protein